MMCSRTQGKLITQNMQSCYSLTMSYYFFGHTSTTVVGQVGVMASPSCPSIISYLFSKEEETGILTGLADFVRREAPQALLMPCDEYDHYYKPPWATSPDLEQKHRDVSQEIGISLKGIKGVFILF